MEQDIIVLSASQWSMADEQTGEVRKGTTVWYVYDSEKHINPDGSCGEVPIKATFDYDYINVIKAQGGAPLKATAKFALRTRKNQASLEVVDIYFKGVAK